MARIIAFCTFIVIIVFILFKGKIMFSLRFGLLLFVPCTLFFGLEGARFSKGLKFPKNIGGFIFDMDGTILKKSEDAMGDLYIKALNCFGVRFNNEEKKALKSFMIGKSPDQILQWAHKRYEVNATIGEIEHTFKDLSQKHKPTKIAFMPGFKQFYKKAKNHGFKMAIATNSSSHEVELFNDVVDLRGLFGEHIYTRSMVKDGKPNPDVYLLAAEKLGLDPAECVAFEDSPTGTKAAQAANIFCFGINQNPTFIEEANKKVKSFHELTIEQFLK